MAAAGEHRPQISPRIGGNARLDSAINACRAFDFGRGDQQGLPAPVLRHPQDPVAGAGPAPSDAVVEVAWDKQDEGPFQQLYTAALDTYHARRRVAIPGYQVVIPDDDRRASSLFPDFAPLRVIFDNTISLATKVNRLQQLDSHGATAAEAVRIRDSPSKAAARVAKRNYGKESRRKLKGKPGQKYKVKDKWYDKRSPHPKKRDDSPPPSAGGNFGSLQV